VICYDMTKRMTTCLLGCCGGRGVAKRYPYEAGDVHSTKERGCRGCIPPAKGIFVRVESSQEEKAKAKIGKAKAGLFYSPTPQKSHHTHHTSSSSLSSEYDIDVSVNTY
jgi:hypothetical protein